MMEQPCYKCGQAVEQGVPFCPHCAAPQIRVAIPEPAPAFAAPVESDPQAPAFTLQSAAATAAPAISAPQFGRSLRPCALAAGIGLLLTCLGLHPLVAIVGAGVLAVAFYRRSAGGAIGPSAGARLGAIAGMIGYGMSAIVGALVVAVGHNGAAIRGVMLEAIQQSAARYSDPQYQAGLDFLRSPAGLGVMMVCWMGVVFLAFLVLASLGGALGGAILGRRDRP